MFEALRARAGGAQRLVAASSIAVLGGAVMPKTVTDATKQTSQITYGVTKTITELLINDYSRKGFFDGRSARLADHLRPPGQGQFRRLQLLLRRVSRAAERRRMRAAGDPERSCRCWATATASPASSACTRPPAAALGDRPGRQPAQPRLHGRGHGRLGEAGGREVPDQAGPDHDAKPDPVIQAIVDGWATDASWDRAKALGLPIDESIDRVVEDYIEDFLPARH